MNSLDHFDCCIIGAGVIGLAAAYEATKLNKSVIILEKNELYGTETSSRNSEVIHAGIYYPTHSLKAQLCVSGKEKLYDFCQNYGVSHRRIEKLIVASSADQADALDALKRKAEANGVADLEWIDQNRLNALEPHVKGNLALRSPSTGIIDSHEYMTTLLGLAEQNGAILSLHTEFLEAQQTSRGFDVSVNSLGERFHFKTDILINSAGLGAQSVAQRIEGIQPHQIPKLYYCKGHYFNYAGKAPFNRLIYPMPEANTTGLGVHATIDMGGQVKFGPDTLYIDEIDYSIDNRNNSKGHAFYPAIQRYFPSVDPARLTPAYSGIRPKIQAPGAPAQDFIIDSSLSGVINLYGIESPGLTASLAIAEQIGSLL